MDNAKKPVSKKTQIFQVFRPDIHTEGRTDGFV